MSKLPTNRTFFAFLFPGQVANDLNTIINQADGMTSKRRDANSFFRLHKFNKRINSELQRRNLNYRISKCFCSKSAFFLYILIIPSFISMTQIATAMNILSEDYNQRG